MPSSAKFGIRINGLFQWAPFILKFESGQRKGVGKSAKEWVGISIKIWIPQAAKGRNTFFLSSQTRVKIRKKITKL